MKPIEEKAALFQAIDLEYTKSAPAAVRAKILTMMRLPLMRPWQFAGSVALLLASPLSFFLFRDRLIYSQNMLLMLNIFSGITAFVIIFAGVAHYYGNTKNKEDLLARVNSLRARF